MHRFELLTRVTSKDRGPTLIGLGLAIVLSAQLWPGLPVAAAMALIGLGATFSLTERTHHREVMALNWLIYASLAALAVAAEFEARPNVWTMADMIVAVVVLAVSAGQTLHAGGHS